MPAISGFATVGPQIPHTVDGFKDTQRGRSVLEGVAVLENTAAEVFDGLEKSFVCDMVNAISLVWYYRQKGQITDGFKVIGKPVEYYNAQKI